MEEAKVIQSELSSSQLSNSEFNAKSCINAAGRLLHYSYSILFSSLISQFGWRRAFESKSFSVSIIIEGTRGY